MIRDRRGFGLTEVVVAIGMFALVSAMISPMLLVRSKRERLATAATYRWALSGESINRVNSTPAAVMVAGTTCDTAQALPIQFTRCVTTTNVSTRLQRVTIVVLPLNLSWIPGDTVIVERANNVGPLDVGAMKSRAGTTLIEFMVVMMIVAVLAGAMTRLVIANSKYDEGTDARREARGVARTSLNILESEIRMAEPAGIIAPTDDSTLTIREPYAFGLVCDTAAAGVTIALLPSADLPSALTASGHAGWAYRDSTGAYQYQANATIAGGTASTCTGVSITPLTASSGRVVLVPKVSGPTIGSIAFVYRQLTYSLRASTSLSGRRALFRTAGANGTAEELSSPFNSAARFRWFILDDAVASDTLPTDWVDMRGVQFVLTAESRYTPRNSSAPVRAPFTTSIFFQNRPN